VNIFDKENNYCSTRQIQLIFGTMGRRSTSRKSLGYNKEKFEDRNLQELRYFQPEENDAGASEGHNF